MTAKEYLGKLYYLESKISEDKRRVERLKEQAIKRTSNVSPDRVQSSGSQTKQADKVCEWVDLEREIAEDEAKVYEIISTIEMLKTYESAVLYHRYRYDKTLGEVSRDIGWSYSKVSKMHGSGLRRVQRILDERKARD